jgi:hypothetical protein
MSKAKVNYWVDLLILVAFGLAGLSGIVLLLIPGGRGATQSIAMGLPRAAWIELHDWTGIASMLGVFLHFVLHWSWLTCMTRHVLRGALPKSGAPVACPTMIETNQ